MIKVDASEYFICTTSFTVLFRPLFLFILNSVSLFSFTRCFKYLNILGGRHKFSQLACFLPVFRFVCLFLLLLLSFLFLFMFFILILRGMFMYISICICEQ